MNLNLKCFYLDFSDFGHRVKTRRETECSLIVSIFPSQVLNNYKFMRS